MARILLRSAKSKRHAIPTGRNGAFPRMGIVAKPLELQGKVVPKLGKMVPKWPKTSYSWETKRRVKAVTP